VPKFLNFKLYKSQYRYNKQSSEFREQLLKEEILCKSKTLTTQRKNLLRNITTLRKKLPIIRFYACLKFLQKIITQFENDISCRHHKKLSELYNGNIILKSDVNRIFNLSRHELTNDERSLLEKGLKLSLKKKNDNIEKKIEIENLFNQIKIEEKKKTIEISKEEEMKTKLKLFGLH
jgi:hypothetical protein